MNHDKIKVGVIGVGRMGEFHLRKYAARPDVELVGFFESDPERAREISAKYSVPAIPSVEILLYEVDAVTIASPTSTHFTVAKKALESGVHVLVEKPIAGTETEARELAALAARLRLQLHVGMVERFRVMSLLRELPARNPRFVQCFRFNTSPGREPGALDVIADLTIHDIDLALYLCKEKVAAELHSSSIVATERVDEIDAKLLFKSGASASLATSRVAFAQRRSLRIVGDGFLYELDLGTNSVKGFSKSSEGVVQEFNYEKKDLDALNEEISAFLAAIRGEEAAHVSAQEAADALAVVAALQGDSSSFPASRRRARPSLG